MLSGDIYTSSASAELFICGGGIGKRLVRKVNIRLEARTDQRLRSTTMLGANPNPQHKQKEREQTMTAYQKYQLQWMIDHDHSLDELIDELDKQQTDMSEEQVSMIFKDWEKNVGFGSEIWACEAEAEDCGELEPAGTSKIEVPLTDGHILVAEMNNDCDYKEIFVGITNESHVWWQDLAIVREAYTYEDLKVIPKHEEYEVLVYGDANDSDITDKIKIPLCKDTAI